MGKNHWKYADRLERFGEMLHELQQYDEALKYHKEGGKIRKEVFGKTHRKYALSLKNIAIALKKLNKFEEALDNLFECHKIIKKDKS